MKLKYEILCLFLLVLLTGCIRQKEAEISQNSVESPVIGNSTNTEILAGTSVETEASLAEEETPKFLENCGLRMPIPEGYASDGPSGYISYSKSIDKEGKKVYLNYIGYTFAQSETKVQEMSMDETIAFFEKRMEHYFENFYEVNFSTFALSPESTEELTILDSPACKVVGHTEVGYGDNTEILAYAAYYAMIPMKAYDNVNIPVCWFAFGSDTEEVRSEMESALLEFAGQAEEY